MCLVYLDNIIVYSKTVEEHLIRLKKLFDRLRIANLKLKTSKCHLLRAEINFLGLVVSAEGVSTDSSKIEAVKDWPVPEDVHEVRSFLGLTSYYRHFEPTFAEIAAPLHALTIKNKKFEWTTLCDHAFIKLKEKLLPIDSDEVARNDTVTVGLHAQWERFKLIDGVVHRRN